MDVGLEGVAQHVTTRRDSTIRSSGCPIWRDDAFDGRSAIPRSSRSWARPSHDVKPTC
jgi:hypothetical protein